MLDKRRYVLLRLAHASLMLLVLCGCTPEEEQSVVSVLQAGLNALTQNRTLTEQFSRDLKANLNPSDPRYQKAQASYENAREVYNGYLDQIEGSPSAHSTLARHLQAPPDEVRDTTVKYLADATAALNPTVNTRDIPYERVATIPEGLQRAFRKLSKRDRKEIIARFDEQVRWKPWTQIKDGE